MNRDFHSEGQGASGSWQSGPVGEILSGTQSGAALPGVFPDLSTTGYNKTAYDNPHEPDETWIARLKNSEALIELPRKLGWGEAVGLAWPIQLQSLIGEAQRVIEFKKAKQLRDQLRSNLMTLRRDLLEKMHNEKIRGTARIDTLTYGNALAAIRADTKQLVDKKIALGAFGASEVQAKLCTKLLLAVPVVAVILQALHIKLNNSMMIPACILSFGMCMTYLLMLRGLYFLYFIVTMRREFLEEKDDLPVLAQNRFATAVMFLGALALVALTSYAWWQADVRFILHFAAMQNIMGARTAKIMPEEAKALALIFQSVLTGSSMAYLHINAWIKWLKLRGKVREDNIVERLSKPLADMADAEARLADADASLTREEEMRRRTDYAGAWFRMLETLRLFATITPEDAQGHERLMAHLSSQPVRLCESPVAPASPKASGTKLGAFFKRVIGFK